MPFMLRGEIIHFPYSPRYLSCKRTALHGSSRSRQECKMETPTTLKAIMLIGQKLHVTAIVANRRKRGTKSGAWLVMVALN